jgi:flagellar assembly protein FliH
MTKVLKFVHAETEGATPFGRDLLESFPDEEREVPTFEAPEEPEEKAMEEASLDPDAIREEIMAAARVDAEEKVQEAYQEGLARGTEAGREAFDATLAKCSKTLNAAGAALEESHRAFLDDLEPQVLSLVKALVTKVIEVELKTNPDVLKKSVERALALLVDGHQVSLLLNPADVEAVKAHEVGLLDSFPGIARLDVLADETVEPGGCIARTDTTDVDARVDTLLAQVLDSLTG